MKWETSEPDSPKGGKSDEISLYQSETIFVNL